MLPETNALVAGVTVLFASVDAMPSEMPATVMLMLSGSADGDDSIEPDDSASTVTLPAEDVTSELPIPARTLDVTTLSVLTVPSANASGATTTAMPIASVSMTASLVAVRETPFGARTCCPWAASLFSISASTVVSIALSVVTSPSPAAKVAAIETTPASAKTVISAVDSAFSSTRSAASTVASEISARVVIVIEPAARETPIAIPTENAPPAKAAASAPAAAPTNDESVAVSRTSPVPPLVTTLPATIFASTTVATWFVECEPASLIEMPT